MKNKVFPHWEEANERIKRALLECKLVEVEQDKDRPNKIDIDLMKANVLMPADKVQVYFEIVNNNVDKFSFLLEMDKVRERFKNKAITPSLCEEVKLEVMHRIIDFEQGYGINVRHAVIGMFGVPEFVGVAERFDEILNDLGYEK